MGFNVLLMVLKVAVAVVLVLTGAARVLLCSLIAVKWVLLCSVLGGRAELWNKYILMIPFLHSNTEPDCFFPPGVLDSLFSLINGLYWGGAGSGGRVLI